MSSPPPPPPPPPSTHRRPIPVLLLKTRSQPADTYEEHLRGRSNDNDINNDSGIGVEPPTANTDVLSFSPRFVPVLEHTRNEATLARLGAMLRSGELKRQYGGMIFTSQRAVEAWAQTVHDVESVPPSSTEPELGDVADEGEDDGFADLDALTPFPLYVVGPATEKALHALLTESRSTKSPSPSSSSSSLFARLNPTIHGASSGNGSALASFILSHYNALHREHWFTYFEAPRLPFIPLLGTSSQNYGRRRLERDDRRLAKKPLLFLVGELRRDVIPRTLTGRQQDPRARIDVHEEEVYRTDVMAGFGDHLEGICGELARGHYTTITTSTSTSSTAGTGADDGTHGPVAAVVVFSPQGSDVLLQKIGYLDDQGKATERATNRWWQSSSPPQSTDMATRWIVAAIGPTTRDHLRDRLGVEPDVCATKPSPEGVRSAIELFLREKLGLSSGGRGGGGDGGA